jgi:hypothetical protein
MSELADTISTTFGNDQMAIQSFMDTVQPGTLLARLSVTPYEDGAIMNVARTGIVGSRNFSVINSTLRIPVSPFSYATLIQAESANTQPASGVFLDRDLKVVSPLTEEADTQTAVDQLLNQRTKRELTLVGEQVIHAVRLNLRSSPNSKTRLQTARTLSALLAISLANLGQEV